MIHSFQCRYLLLLLPMIVAGEAHASCMPIADEGKKVTLRVEACEEVKGVDVIAKVNPQQAISDTPEKEALALLYDGRVVTGTVTKAAGSKLSQSSYKVFISAKGPDCADLAGGVVRGRLNFNCCDGDPGVPCLMEGVDAALGQPKLSKSQGTAKTPKVKAPKDKKSGKAKIEPEAPIKGVP